MTENEALNTLHILLAHEKAIDAGEIVSPNNLHSQEKEALQFILEEIQSYRAIGTVEEFKAYKLGDCMNDCEHYENCSNYIYSKGYNKAIDDFAEKIADWCDFCNGGMRKECVKDSKCKIYEIAEQLKGEKQ